MSNTLKRHHQVTIYVSPGSPFCDLAKDYFRTAGIDFDEVDISIDTEAEARLTELTEGVIQTPSVEFDGRIIAGYQPDMYEILLKNTESEDDAREEKNKDDDTPALDLDAMS